MTNSYIIALCVRLDKTPTTLRARPYVAQHLQYLRDQNFPAAVIAGLEAEVESFTRADWDHLECKITAIQVVEPPKNINRMVSLFKSITL